MNILGASSRESEVSKLKKLVERMCLHWIYTTILAAIQNSGYCLLTPIFGTVAHEPYVHPEMREN